MGLQPATGTFTPAEGMTHFSAKAVLELREAFPEPLRLSPAQFVTLEWAQLQALWKVRCPEACIVPASKALSLISKLL